MVDDFVLRRRVAPAQRGQAGLFLTLSIPVLFGLLGLVTEVGWAYWRKEAAKTAAQSAAVAIVNAAGSSTPATLASTACPSSPSTSTAWQVGCLFATQNGFTNGSYGQSVSVQIGSLATGIPVSGVSPTKYWVAVTASETEKPLFSYLVGGRGVTVLARSTAAVYASSGGGCIYVLDPSADKSLNMSGANFTSGCGIYVNSNKSDASYMSGGNLTLNNNSKFTIDGGLSWTGGIICGNTPPNVPGCVNQNTGTRVNDPFSGMTTPTVSSGCDYSNFSISGGIGPTASPGTYCGNLSVNGGVNVYFNSGIYVLKSGSLNISGGNFSSTASNVLFYIPPSNTTGQINISGGNMVWNGISGHGADGFLFWAANSAAQVITGSNYTFNGVLYMPNSLLTYNGGNGAQQTVVADTLTVTGGNITSSYSSGNFTGSGISGTYIVE